MVAWLGSMLPDCWLSAAVKDCQDDDALHFHTEVNTVRKSLGYDTAYAIVDHGIELGPVGGERNASVDFSDKFGAKLRRCASYQAAALMNSARAAR